MNDMTIVVMIFGLFSFGMGFIGGVVHRKGVAHNEAWERMKPLEDKYNELIAKYEKKLEGAK